MSILEIKKYPDSVLRKKAEKVKEITPEIRKLALDMIEAMNQDQGIGFAAPQVGELKRIITVYLIQEGGDKSKLMPLILINPKIIKKSRKTEMGEEGCLSFPNLFLKIKRAKEIEIEAQNEEGKNISFRAKGLPARVIQHEIDHLDGILFIDKISFWQRRKIEKKFKKL